MYFRYANARKPQKGNRSTVAYRMRNLFLDRWNVSTSSAQRLWPRLTFYRTWRDEYGNVILDGTNNHSEHSIGWHVKKRYRSTPALHRTQCVASVRSYKREQSALNVNRLIAFAGNHSSCGLDLANLIA